MTARAAARPRRVRPSAIGERGSRRAGASAEGRPGTRCRCPKAPRGPSLRPPPPRSGVCAQNEEPRGVGPCVAPVTSGVRGTASESARGRKRPGCSRADVARRWPPSLVSPESNPKPLHARARPSTSPCAPWALGPGVSAQTGAGRHPGRGAHRSGQCHRGPTGHGPCPRRAAAAMPPSAWGSQAYC